MGGEGGGGCQVRADGCYFFILCLPDFLQCTC